MNVFLRAAADVVGFVVSEALSRTLDVLAPLPKRQPVALDVDDDVPGLPGFYEGLGDPPVSAECWDEINTACRTPRVVEDRGLGADERGPEWVDKDKDLWRWNRKLSSWQNKMSQPTVCSTWYAVPTEDGTTSAAYAPYTEVVAIEDGPPQIPGVHFGVTDGLKVPSADVVAAPASGSPAEVKVPGAAPEAPAPGTPSRVNPDAAPVLREAAKALRGWTTGQRMVEELLPYWRNVAHCLDIYADECDWNARPTPSNKKAAR